MSKGELPEQSLTAMVPISIRTEEQKGTGGNQVAAMTNTVVSNVPGPQLPLYLAGARLAMVCGGAPPMHGTGLINVVGSYCGSVMMQFTACREMMPDPEYYGDCYNSNSAYEGLLKAL